MGIVTVHKANNGIITVHVFGVLKQLLFLLILLFSLLLARLCCSHG